VVTIFGGALSRGRARPRAPDTLQLRHCRSV